MVGLGNPGERYRGTRHNFGFEVLDAWVEQRGASWRTASFAQAETCRLEEDLWLVKPLAFMNLSGPEVQRCLRWWRLPVEEVIVVVDDIQLPLGRLRLRPSGSSGGHNGLRSIEESLGTTAYARIRGGVGGSDQGVDWKQHVLERFGRQETETAGKMVRRAVDALQLTRTDGLAKAMERYNGDD